MELIEYADREMLALGLADALASILRDRVSLQGGASFCVPGGSTPADTFAILSGAALDWSRVRVFLGDERWVPVDHARSNTRLLHETLLTGPAAAARWVPMASDAATPEQGIDALLPALEDALPIDLLLLGMGADMHTASLLPDDPDLAAHQAADAPTLVAVRAPSQPEPRVTLSQRVLRDAMATHVLIQGEEKRQVVEAAAGQDPARAPIAPFLSGAVVHWAP